MAKQYLRLELQRLIGHREDQEFWQKLKIWLDDIDQSLDEPAFWGLVSGFSQGYRLNGVFKILTNDAYEWVLGDLPLTQIVLTGTNPDLNSAALDRAKRDPLKLQKLWQTEVSVKQTFAEYNIRTSLGEDYEPIFVYEKEGKFWVFDGMNRLFGAIFSGHQTIRAWQGRLVKPDGQSLINAGFGLILSNILGRQPAARKNCTCHYPDRPGGLKTIPQWRDSLS